MKLNSIITKVLFLLVAQASAQTFSIPLEGFSRQKTSYLHMEDGKVKEGELGGFKREKGLIEMVKLQDPDGGKIKIDPAKISFMYLPPSNLAKMSVAMEKAYDVNKWKKSTNVDTTLMNDGYVFFEKVPTIVKKKTDNLMLQLLNASFNSAIRVYHDPFAKETMSVGVGSMTLAGGLDKSYYVKKNSDKAAYRLYKKDYQEQFSELFGDCPEFMKKYKDDINWSDFEKHVYDYTLMKK